MFAWCTEALHLSEAEAYLRIAAARASREHPILLAMLADGRLHLTAMVKLAPHLTPANREAVLRRAAHKSKREIEELVAEMAPRPDAPSMVRRLPDRRVKEPSAPTPRLAPRAAGPSLDLRLDGAIAVTAEPNPNEVPAPGPELRLDGVVASPAPGLARRAVVAPLAPGRYRVQFTASAALRDKLERLQGLMRSSVPDGDLAAIIEQAVTEKLERLESRRFGRTNTPRRALAESDTSPKTRQVPAAVKRAVHERDGGRCHYVDDQGRRCAAREGLEFHHRQPFGCGGDHSVENIALVCRAHNACLAEVDYGRRALALHRRARERVVEPTLPSSG
jgi:5-methylcytosine-specific restriction endonuclease McrA